MLRLHVLQDFLNHVCVLIRATQSAGLLDYLMTRANRCTQYLDLMIFYVLRQVISFLNPKNYEKMAFAKD